MFRNGLHTFVSGASLCGVIGIFLGLIFLGSLAVSLGEMAGRWLTGGS
jgi:hypothetical protein